MSQNSLVLPTTGTISGLVQTQNMNNALDTLNTLASGAAAPGSPEAGQLWHDTTNNQLKIRDLANTTWTVIAAIDETNKIWVPPVGGGTASIASASTTDLWSVAQAAITVSGTTTITSLCGASDSISGTVKFVTFSGALTLTYNASSLILPTAANITTTAGDTMVVQSLGSGNVRVISYNRANGAPLTVASQFVIYNAISGLLPTSQTFTSSTIASMTITAGQAADSTNTFMLKGGSFSWNITNGNAANGYQGGTTLPNSSTIHFYIITHADGTSPASFASTSLTPTLPTGYTSGLYRRIFSLYTNGSGVLVGGTPIETEGGSMTYYLTTQVLDFSSTVSTTQALITLSVPTGIRVRPSSRMGASIGSGAFGIIFTSGDEVDTAPSAQNVVVPNNAPGWDNYYTSAAQVPIFTQPSLITNTSGQMGARATTAGVSLNIDTRGWTDFRRS